ncbi:zinc finger protein 385D isoform X2 [Stigmatopora nigra]
MLRPASIGSALTTATACLHAACLSASPQARGGVGRTLTRTRHLLDCYSRVGVAGASGVRTDTCDASESQSNAIDRGHADENSPMNRPSSGGARPGDTAAAAAACRLCRLRLNSPAQAQIHYKGKSHQRRLRRRSSGVHAGTSGRGGPAMTPSAGALPGPEPKRLLPFPLNASWPLSLFPNFNAMDPVQKAVINHTFGVPQPLKKKAIISCNICHLRFNSTNQAEAHYKGHKHARKLKATEAQKNRQQRQQRPQRQQRRRRSVDPSSGAKEQRHGAEISPPALWEGTCHGPQPEAPSSPDVKTGEGSPGGSPCGDAEAHVRGDASAEAPAQPDGQKDKERLRCPACRVTVNSASQLEAHNSGAKHKLTLEGQSPPPRRRSGGKTAPQRASCRDERSASKGAPGGVSAGGFRCRACEISLNSETQLGQHMNSRRHKDRMAGKPPRPKFTPHGKSRQQHNSLMNMPWSAGGGGAGLSAVSLMKKALGQYGLASLSSQTKVALQKQLSKSLGAGFLAGPLTAPALCTVASNPLALRHPLGAAFIHAPFLGPALFRPAPGPLRAAHAPVIFSPY